VECSKVGSVVMRARGNNCARGVERNSLEL
jgi:hypothetical protein